MSNTGVKNLRAMFENRKTSYDQSISPPSRGRSPTESVSSKSSRPVSKVRASFVAVERPGDIAQSSIWGLRKTSDGSSMAEVREETGVNQSARPAANNMTIDGHDLGMIMKGSSFGSVDGKAKAPMTTASSAKPAPASKPATSEIKMNGGSNTVAAMVGKMQSSEAPKHGQTSTAPKTIKSPPASIATNPTTVKSKESPGLSKKSPTSQKKAQDVSPAAVQNTNAIKPRGGVSKIQGVIASANKAKAERAKMEDARPLPKEQNSPEVVADNGQGEKKEAENISRAAKPALSKPATKSAVARKSMPPESIPKKSATERRSLAPQQPRAVNATTKASLAKKSSRASLAPADQMAKSRQSTTFKPADEGFLARLTRPTASSAQKAHGKIEVASPQKTRQVSANLPKQPARKSLSPADHGAASTSQQASIASVQEDTDIPLGEPGPAEETEQTAV